VEVVVVEVVDVVDVVVEDVVGQEDVCQTVSVAIVSYSCTCLICPYF